MSATERPMLFTGEMVRAVLAGTKTQTRRLAKVSDHADEDRCPWVGNIWVRETWAEPKESKKFPFEYRADWREIDDVRSFNWRPSIHMPRRACRIILEITDVRCERLQDIDDEDAEAEGVLESFDDHPEPPNARAQFRRVWDALYAKRGHGWETNPWVWAISFRRVKP